MGQQSKTQTDARGRLTREKWPGGYVNSAGVYVIERRIGGVKFHTTTRCTSLRGALKQLETFEANPSGYHPAGDAVSTVVLDQKLIDEFSAWHKTRVTEEWAGEVRQLILWWANEVFRGKDLRRLELVADLKEPLTGLRQRAGRIKAIKILFRWLRAEKGLVQRADDRTLDLPVPQSRPAQEKRVKAVEFSIVAACAKHLGHEYRDVLTLLCGTGWHLTEVRRFAEVGSIRERRGNDAPHVVGVIGVQHKSGKQHFTALTHQEHFDAAKRIRERGWSPRNKILRENIWRACDAAGVRRFNIGSIRHSVATWLIQAGVPIEQVRVSLHISYFVPNRAHSSSRGPRLR